MILVKTSTNFLQTIRYDFIWKFMRKNFIIVKLQVFKPTKVTMQLSILYNELVSILKKIYSRILVYNISFR